VANEIVGLILGQGSWHESSIWGCFIYIPKHPIVWCDRQPLVFITIGPLPLHGWYELDVIVTIRIWCGEYCYIIECFAAIMWEWCVLQVNIIVSMVYLDE
jgi:hypothetical protein